MLYRVLVDGEDILDYDDRRLVLLSPQANIELDIAGSFEFTIPPSHKLYTMFDAESIMPMTVEVYEGDVLQWFGRPIELHLDFYENKKIYCEGALAFFNDSVVRENEYDSVQLSTIFGAVISEHNSMVPSNRQFTVGNFTVNDRAVYRKFNYEQTSDALKSKFLDAEEGHFFVRRENGVNYIDFLKDMPYSCNQHVEFSKNLLNLTYSFDGKDFATCVIPLGGNDTTTGKPVNISAVNNSSDILVGNSADKYGKIVKVQQYGDITDPVDLMTEGQKYLTTLQYNAFLIECSAVDLHATDPEKQQFRVGQTVHCSSEPHGIDLDLPISKMTLYLDSAAKQITLGRIPKKTLSRFYKERGIGGSSEPDEGTNLDDWIIVPPDDDGGTPTMKKVPVRIQITSLPYITAYGTGSGDTKYFNTDGLVVKLLASGLPDLTYFTDERYPDSIIPMEELSFTYNVSGTQTNLTAGTDITAIQHATIQVWVWWRSPYTGQKHGQAFNITNKVQAAADAANMPTHIAVIYTGMDHQKFHDGQYINFSKIKVKAYLQSGQPYTAAGYTDGIIPNSELIFPIKQAKLDNSPDIDIDPGEPTPTVDLSEVNSMWYSYGPSGGRYWPDILVWSSIGPLKVSFSGLDNQTPSPITLTYQSQYGVYAGNIDINGSDPSPIWGPIALDPYTLLPTIGPDGSYTGQQAIPVRWKNPAGTILETHFFITLDSSASGGGVR